jgi:hypothetical protein
VRGLRLPQGGAAARALPRAATACANIASTLALLYNIRRHVALARTRAAAPAWLPQEARRAVGLLV